MNVLERRREVCCVVTCGWVKLDSWNSAKQLCSGKDVASSPKPKAATNKGLEEHRTLVECVHASNGESVSLSIPTYSRYSACIAILTSNKKLLGAPGLTRT